MHSRAVYEVFFTQLWAYYRGLSLKRRRSVFFEKSGFPGSGYPDGSGTIRGPSGSQGESLDTHIVGSLSLKSRKNEKSGFSKNRISRSGSGLGDSGPSGGWPWGPKRSIEAKKAKKKFPEKPDFPDPDEQDPDVVLRERWGGRGLPVAKISDL